MPCAERLSFLRIALYLWSCVICGVASAQPTVWTGLTLDVVKPDFADPAEFNDPISPSVALARGDIRGLFNIVQETEFDFPAETSLSPIGTEWATGINNVGDLISASNWETLDFARWVDAYGGAVGVTIVDAPAVLHLVAEDIYLDIQFTSWTTSSGGGFAYSRAEGELPQPPSTTGDYNLNGVVDAADYTVWRDTLGQNVTPGEGADGDESGIIDPGDYDFWKQHFGEVVPGPGATGSASVSAAVPEPTTAGLLLIGLLIVRLRSRRRL